MRDKVDGGAKIGDEQSDKSTSTNITVGKHCLKWVIISAIISEEQSDSNFFAFERMTRF